MPINNLRSAEQMGQKARKKQAKSFRTNATPTTDQGKGSVAKSKQSKQQARKSQAKSFRTDASPTTDQGKGSVAESETIQTTGSKKPGKELSNRCVSDDRPGKRISRRTRNNPDKTATTMSRRTKAKRSEHRTVPTLDRKTTRPSRTSQTRNTTQYLVC